MPHPEPALEARELRKSFGKGSVIALDGVSVTVSAGEVVGLVGPDGAGKTTLVRLCAGLRLADGGALSVLGIDVGANPLRVQEQVGYMPQRLGLYEDLTVQENLDLYADLQAIPASRRKQRYTQLFEMTGLADFKTRLAGPLSGGMKQKLGLACALIKMPRLLLLDEPTVGVDRVSRRDLWAIVRDMVREHGIGVLLSTAYLVGVGLLISSLARTMQQALLGTFLFMMPASLLSELATPIDDMPSWIRHLTLLNPSRYALNIARDVFLRGATLPDTVGDLIPMTIIGVICLAAAGVMFRLRSQ